MNKLIKLIEEKSVYSKDKSNKLGEVFTSTKLIIDMMSALPKDTWTDKTKTIFDPCAGFANFQAVVITKLMKSLKKDFKDPEKRYKHILENMIYMAEYQRESAEFIYDTFSLDGTIKINLYIGDTLTMPDDFFDLSYNERKEKYPDNCI